VQLQNLSVGATRRHRTAREEYRLRHHLYRPQQPPGLVPENLAACQGALFESNAIAEYLDETVAPQLHPADPITRARNRAWTDYVTTFASAISQTAYSDTEEEFTQRAAKIADVFGKLDDALTKRGNDGPYFNGPKLSLVDAAYAPFLQRYTFMDRLKPLGIIEKFPHLKAWRDALLAAPAVKASTVANIEAAWQENMIINKRWLAKYVSESVLGAAAA
jgi:glutathione S-transferase